MTLQIFANGRCILAAPYSPDRARDVAIELDRQWHYLNALGRFFVIIDDGAVAWLIGKGG